MVRRSGQMGVPVITVDDEVVVGFDRPRLEQILARRQKKRPVLGAEVAREGDVLLSLNRRPVRDANDIERALNSLAVGQAAEIVWWRDGQELRAQVLFS
jgi:S1-C subfamily serine protease